MSDTRYIRSYKDFLNTFWLIYTSSNISNHKYFSKEAISDEDFDKYFKRLIKDYLLYFNIDFTCTHSIHFRIHDRLFWITNVTETTENNTDGSVYGLHHIAESILKSRRNFKWVLFTKICIVVNIVWTSIVAPAVIIKKFSPAPTIINIVK